MKGTASTSLSPWHSPMPYFLGGLAAILGLIAFALLILACSYFNFADDIENASNGRQVNLEAGNSKLNNHNKKFPTYLEEKYLVIMAGQAAPTFLATPISSKELLSSGNSKEGSSISNIEIMVEKGKERNYNHV
uniref:protein GLUTAMINE DUMPER 3-like n=1 Tax=Erigeron canadensis TaxID=72917 RepID=UPI001CB96286|nr:protein GLUTAMINE DUMPER 3-like [Erigeron canadensis]